MSWRTRWVTLLSIVVLLVCLSWLQKVNEARVFLGGNPRFSLVDGRVTLREQHLGQYLNGKKVGYTLMRLSQENEGIGYYHSRVESQFNVSLLGQQVSFTQISDATLNKDLTLSGIRSVFRTIQAQDTVTTATVNDSMLDIANQSMGQVTRRQQRLEGPIYTLEALYPLIMQRNLRAGASLDLKIFEPTLGGVQDVAIRVIGPRIIQRKRQPVETTLVEVDVLGTTQRSWLEKDGSPVVEETSMGGLAMVGLQEPAADASDPTVSHLEDWQYGSQLPRGTAVEDLFTSTLIDTNVTFPNSSHVFSATYRLSDVPSDTFISGSRQTVLAASPEAHSVRMHVESPAYATLAARFHRSYRLGEDLSRDFAAECSPTLRIESDNSEIRLLARQIVGDETDPYRAALKLQEWMSDEANLKKEIRATIPDAVEVLKTRSGDCNEHAVLFAALGRAVGLPTKMVTGIVYSPDLEKFGYHAWNEVLVGLDPPTWYALDATLDQVRVDATHVKIAEGEIDQQVAIIPLVGKMKLYVEGYD